MLFKKFDLATRVSAITIFFNILLFILKFFSGIVSHSKAMLSDAVHTLSDVFSTVVVIIGIRLSRRGADKTHQYGHDRMEPIASVLLSFLLFVTGFAIGWSSIESIFSDHYSVVEAPGLLALVASLISILVKEIMYWYTRFAAKKIESQAMLADAWHHRSDALSSVGAFLGIVGARMGFFVLDSIASILISLCICKISIDIFLDSVNKLVDKSCDDAVVNQIVSIIKSQDELVQIDEIKTRLFGNKIYVDIEISLDGNRSLFDSHEVARRIHDIVEEELSLVKHCMIHVNPY